MLLSFKGDDASATCWIVDWLFLRVGSYWSHRHRCRLVQPSPVPDIIAIYLQAVIYTLKDSNESMTVSLYPRYPTSYARNSECIPLQKLTELIVEPASHHMKQLRRRKVARIFRPELQSVRELSFELVERKQGIPTTHPRTTNGEK